MNSLTASSSRSEVGRLSPTAETNSLSSRAVNVLSLTSEIATQLDGLLERVRGAHPKDAQPNAPISTAAIEYTLSGVEETLSLIERQVAELSSHI